MVINGELRGFFEGKRGLQQGDPLSPFLFVVCVEMMSRILGSVDEDTRFRFHPKCDKLRLTHVCFADDLILFCRGDMGSLMCIKKKLEIFLQASGLAVNLQKNEVFLAGVHPDAAASMVQEMGMVRGTLPVRYLGVPLHGRSLHLSEYNGLIMKMIQKVASWSAKHLSYAGRRALVQSVLMTVQQFWGSLFFLPKGVIAKIQQVCRSFLWSGVSQGAKWNPVAWDMVSRPVEKGGLGFKEVLSWNKASLAGFLYDLHHQMTSM